MRLSYRRPENMDKGPERRRINICEVRGARFGLFRTTARLGELIGRKTMVHNRGKTTNPFYQWDNKTSWLRAISGRPTTRLLAVGGGNGLMVENMIELMITECLAKDIFPSKPEASIWFPLLYRKLNADMLRELNHLLPTEEFSNCMGEEIVFSTLEAYFAYWQIKIDEHNESNTGLALHHGLYRDTTVSFRLKKPPVTVRGSMDVILAFVHCQLALSTWII